MDVAPPLRVYPALWNESRRQFPHDWQWPDQLRCLCALARDYRRHHGRICNALPPGERLFLRSLATLDPDELIAMLRVDFPHEANPMRRIDPFGPVRRETLRHHERETLPCMIPRRPIRRRLPV
jgi:hypothetical protein